MARQKMDAMNSNGLLAVGQEEQRMWWPGHAWENWLQRVITVNELEPKLDVTPESEISSSEVVSVNSRRIEEPQNRISELVAGSKKLHLSALFLNHSRSP